MCSMFGVQVGIFSTFVNNISSSCLHPPKPPCTQVSTSAALQGYKLQVERMTRIANALPAFTSLCKQDQVILASHWLTQCSSLIGPGGAAEGERGPGGQPPGRHLL